MQRHRASALSAGSVRGGRVGLDAVSGAARHRFVDTGQHLVRGGWCACAGVAHPRRRRWCIAVGARHRCHAGGGAHRHQARRRGAFQGRLRVPPDDVRDLRRGAAVDRCASRQRHGEQHRGPPRGARRRHRAAPSRRVRRAPARRRRGLGVSADLAAGRLGGLLEEPRESPAGPQRRVFHDSSFQRGDHRGHRDGQNRSRHVPARSDEPQTAQQPRPGRRAHRQHRPHRVAVRYAADRATRAAAPRRAAHPVRFPPLALLGIPHRRRRRPRPPRRHLRTAP